MLMGAAGNAILFFFAGVGIVVVGGFVLSYAAHCFLVVLEGTAAGNDAVVWPDEPMVDWLWKPCYLGWLIAFWFVPAWLILDVFIGGVLQVPVPNYYALLLGVVWLLFPISLFSSLSAHSRLVVMRLALLRRLPRH